MAHMIYLSDEPEVLQSAYDLEKLFQIISAMQAASARPVYAVVAKTLFGSTDFSFIFYFNNFFLCPKRIFLFFRKGGGT